MLNKRIQGPTVKLKNKNGEFFVVPFTGNKMVLIPTNMSMNNTSNSNIINDKNNNNYTHNYNGYLNLFYMCPDITFIQDSNGVDHFGPLEYWA